MEHILQHCMASEMFSSFDVHICIEQIKKWQKCIRPGPVNGCFPLINKLTRTKSLVLAFSQTNRSQGLSRFPTALRTRMACFFKFSSYFHPMHDGKTLTKHKAYLKFQVILHKLLLYVGYRHGWPERLLYVLQVFCSLCLDFNQRCIARAMSHST